MPALIGPAPLARDRPRARSDRRHDGAAAMVDRPARRACGQADRAGQALLDPRPPPGAGGEHQMGRRLAPGVRLRRPGGRGAERPHRGGPDRCIHARQADRARPAGGRVPGSDVPEPAVEPRDGARPLRRAVHRRRPDHGRRHDQPPRRADLLRDDDLQRGRVPSSSGSRGGSRTGRWTCTSATSPRRSAR